MDRENLFVVKKHYFREFEIETCYNVPGDLKKYDNEPEQYDPKVTTLVGVFSKNNIADVYLGDKTIIYRGDTDESDAYGSYKRYTFISGYYHTSEELELDTIIINGIKYAKYDNAFVKIDENVHEDSLEQETLSK